MIYVIRVALLFALFAGPAPAAVLYKSVAPNGTLEFSDIPPEKGRAVERILFADPSPPANARSIAAGLPREEPSSETDAAIARANAQFDFAEHSLAVARRLIWSQPDPSRLGAPRITRAEIERSEFYKRSVLFARQTLMEVLQQQRKAAARQTFTASNEWTPVYSAGAAIPVDRR